MDETVAQTWTELTDALVIPPWNADLQRFRSRAVYRGMADSTWPLAPSLARLGGGFVRLEEPMLRNFRKYARSQGLSGNSDWDWLALAQHHGLPTRLLDWTYSPLVALHFVTEHCFGESPSAKADGVVWSVDLAGLRRELPERLQAVLSREDSDAFTTEMLAEVAPTLSTLDDLADRPFPLFFEPSSLDARIINQFALFSLMAQPGGPKRPWIAIGEWLERRPHLARRVIVPAALKGQIRDILDQNNITERVLYPGPDGISRWLKRYYMPRMAAAAREEKPREGT